MDYLSWGFCLCWKVALELGTFLCLSDDDLHRIIEHQEQMEWGVR